MAEYTGMLTDCGYYDLAPRAMQISVRLERPAYSIDGRRLVVTGRKKWDAIEGDAGRFSFNLIPSADLVGGPLYILSAAWLSYRGDYEEQDLFKFYAKAGGGNIAEGMDLANLGGSYWIAQDTQPDPWPKGVVWLNTLTWDVKENI